MGVEIPSENIFRTFVDNNTFDDDGVNIFNTFVEDVEIFNTFEDNNTSDDNTTIPEEDCYISVDENGEYVVDGEVDVF